MSAKNRHVITRAAHKNEVAEDYVEAILHLIAEDGDARLMEIARHFDVAHPTVVKILKRLQEEGLVEVLPRKEVVLTTAGTELALASQARHRTVVEFLVKFGLSPEQAEIDAEGIEHHASPELLNLMENFART